MMSTYSTLFCLALTSLCMALADPQGDDFYMMEEQQPSFLRRQLGFFAKTNPRGLEILRNEIDSALKIFGRSAR